MFNNNKNNEYIGNELIEDVDNLLNLITFSHNKIKKKHKYPNRGFQPCCNDHMIYDQYLEKYNKSYNEYMERKKNNSSIPFLQNLQDKVANYTILKDKACISDNKIKKCFTIKINNNYLEKGLVTNLKSSNYYDKKKEIELNNYSYDELPNRNKLPIDFKCPRDYKICHNFRK